MKLEEAIKELLTLHEDLANLPSEIKAHEGMVDKLINEEDQGNGLEVDQVQDVFDITQDINKLKEEEKVISDRIATLKETILDYLKAVQFKKVTFTNPLDKSGDNQFVFEAIDGQLAVNGNII